MCVESVVESVVERVVERVESVGRRLIIFGVVESVVGSVVDVCHWSVRSKVISMDLVGIKKNKIEVISK